MRFINRRAAGVAAAVSAVGLASTGVAYAHGDFGHGQPQVLHGQFAVAKAGGGTITQDVQNGRVTANSPSSITVRSKDGFAQTYDITDRTRVKAADGGIAYGGDGAKLVHNGDRVWVVAVERGATPNASGVFEFGSQSPDGARYYPR